MAVAKSSLLIFSSIFPPLHVLCVAVTNGVFLLHLVYKCTLYTGVKPKRESDINWFCPVINREGLREHHKLNCDLCELY